MVFDNIFEICNTTSEFISASPKLDLGFMINTGLIFSSFVYIKINYLMGEEQSILQKIEKYDLLERSGLEMNDITLKGIGFYEHIDRYSPRLAENKKQKSLRKILTA